MKHWEFPGSPVVRTQGFHAGGPGSIPGRGAKILQAEWCSQKKKGMKHWHLLQHRWTSEMWRWVKEARCKRPHIVWFHLHEMPGISKSIETEGSLVVSGDGGRMRKWRFNVYEVFFGADEKVSELIRGDGCTSLWTCLTPLNYPL